MANSSKSKAKKEPTNIYYVTAREDNRGKKIGWEVKRGGASKVTAIVDTKEEALDKVREFAKNSEATVMIYRQDGSLQDTLKFGPRR